MALVYVPYEGPIVTRAEAKALRLKRYFTGRPCPSGHISQKLTSSGGCVECVRIATSKLRSTRQAKDIRNAKAREKWARKREPSSRRCIPYPPGVDKAQERKRRRRYDKIKEQARRDNNRETIRATARKWYYANREQALTVGRNRRARLKEAVGTHTKGDIAFLFAKQKGKCALSWCRGNINNKYHVDHIMPVALGGANDRTNLQLLCPSCNHRKNAKHPIDFAQANGLLL